MAGNGVSRGRHLGAWRSLVARLNGVQEVESSNLSAPTIKTVQCEKCHV